MSTWMVGTSAAFATIASAIRGRAVARGIAALGRM
jgi:hypothetical protein